MQVGERTHLLGPDEIRRWRENVPPGHTRRAFVFRGPGGRNDPDQPIPALSPDEGVVVGDSVHLDTPELEKGIRDGRDTTERFVKMLLEWARSPRHEEHRLARARILKATSPMQFSHMTEQQLADELAEIAVEKAKEAVARTYRMRGWDRGVDLDRTTGPATPAPVLLPGQTRKG